MQNNKFKIMLNYLNRYIWTEKNIKRKQKKIFIIKNDLCDMYGLI